MLSLSLIAAALVGMSYGQNQYPNYEETAAQDNPPAYANPDYQNNPAPAQPHYPDYSEVETVATTTTTTTTEPWMEPPKRPQVFPPTPTRRRTTRRPQPNRIVRWYFMDSRGVPIRTAVSRRYKTSSLKNGMPAYYRNILSGSRSLGQTVNGNGQHTKRVEYWWYV
uniref:Uncharacterized protein n=1 Tax=Anopheles dirus TaxID=7168 RepID=A0A182NZ51_9DIPT